MSNETETQVETQTETQTENVYQAAAKGAVDEIRSGDAELAALDARREVLLAKRAQCITTVKNLEIVARMKLLPEDIEEVVVNKTSGKTRRRSKDSLGGLILQALNEGPKNAKGLEAAVVAAGYEFNGATKPYQRIHSELQRLKNGELAAPTPNRRGFYSISCVLEDAVMMGDEDEGETEGSEESNEVELVAVEDPTLAQEVAALIAEDEEDEIEGEE